LCNAGRQHESEPIKIDGIEIKCRHLAIDTATFIKIQPSSESNDSGVVMHNDYGKIS